MKTKVLLIMALAVMAFASCKKESCVTCTLTEYPTGVSHSETFCGTDKEIADEDAKWKNQAAQGNAQYPGYTYIGGCD